jgi:hypothetical protein
MTKVFGRINLRPKDLYLLIEAFEFRLAQYRSEVDSTSDENAKGDLENDAGLLSSLLSTLAAERGAWSWEEERLVRELQKCRLLDQSRWSRAAASRALTPHIAEQAGSRMRRASSHGRRLDCQEQGREIRTEAAFPVNMNAWPIMPLLFLAGCVGGRMTAHNSMHPYMDMYKRGDGRETIQCRAIQPRNICETLSAPVLLYFDCSDTQFECVFDTMDVLAIPRAGLALGQQYSVYGAKLTVERCFGDQTSCTTALISSKCVESLTCSCRSGTTASTAFFYFSRDIGVTAFYSAPDISPDLGIDAKMRADFIPLVTYALVAEKGFLRAPLTLDRTRLDSNCHQSLSAPVKNVPSFSG